MLLFISLGMILGVGDCSWALAVHSNAIYFGVFKPVDFAREVGDADNPVPSLHSWGFFSSVLFFFFSLFSP